MKIRHTYLTLILGICLGAGALSSCNFLEVDPVGRTTIPLYFSNIEGIRAALPGAYSAMYDYYDNHFSKYPEVAADMTRLNILSSSVDMIDQYNYTSDGTQEVGAVGAIWSNIYKAMADVNNIIEYQPSLLDKYPQNADELNRILGEALFLRALCHFDLCRVYAQPYNYTSDASHLGVPVLLRTPGADENVSRKTVAQVYEQIIKDLKQAETLLSTTQQKDAYHASLKSVQALLSRVYLYKEDWQECISYSTKAIESTPLCQRSEYVGMYQDMKPGEAIFRLNGTLKSSKLSKFYSVTDPIAYPADTLLSFFDDTDDIRLELLKADDQGHHLIRKYQITSDVSEINMHWDPMVLRVSEMYLNRAEAYLNTNQNTLAANDIKTLIARATGKNAEQIQLDETTSVLDKTIEKERIKELCFEGHRFFDIVRRKQDLVREAATNSSVQRIAYPSDYFVLPISDKELEANKNMQPNPTVNK